MSLQRTKNILEGVIIASALGLGYKADWWHFEDEAGRDKVLKRREKELDRVLTSVLEDLPDTPGQDRSAIQDGQLMCRKCKTYALESKVFNVRQETLYGEPGLKATIGAYCPRCHGSYALNFQYNGDWDEETKTGLQINMQEL